MIRKERTLFVVETTVQYRIAQVMNILKDTDLFEVQISFE